MRRNVKSLSGRAPRRDLMHFVETLPTPSTLLGLTHITSSYNLRDIIADKKILANAPCDIIGEKLIYTYYGRASLRKKIDFEPTDLVSVFPSVLIIDPNKTPKPKYVFCFDSGAFVEGLMDSYLAPYMPLFDFLLAPDANSAARLVNFVFPSKDDYLQNRSSVGFTSPASNFELDSYLKIVTGGGRGSNRLDDRASTPEILFSDPIGLRKAVIAAVLPDTLASDPAIGGRLKNFGIDVYEYPFVSGSRPVENNNLIRQIVKQIYVDFEMMIDE